MVCTIFVPLKFYLDIFGDNNENKRGKIPIMLAFVLYVYTYIYIFLFLQELGNLMLSPRKKRKFETSAEGRRYHTNYFKRFITEKKNLISYYF